MKNMKASNVLGFLFVILIGMVSGALLFRSCSSLPDGKVIVNQSAVDSLNAYIAFTDSVKNLLLIPDTIKIDTIYVEKIHYTTSVPDHVIDDSDPDVVHVSDSLIVKDTVYVWTDIIVRGRVQDITINWRYKPTIRKIETTIEIPTPYPVIETITNEVIKYSTGHYLSLAAGGNAKMFNFGLDYTITRENWIYGLEYRRYGDQNVYGFQVGVNLRTLFKKNH